MQFAYNATTERALQVNGWASYYGKMYSRKSSLFSLQVDDDRTEPSLADPVAVAFTAKGNVYKRTRIKNTVKMRE